jgi:hypothetical protein
VVVAADPSFKNQGLTTLAKDRSPFQGFKAALFF